MWVKICGITRPEDAQAAADAGADAIGFVFWPHSPRSIAAGDAAAIGEDLRGLSRVGVFVNQSAAKITDIAREAHLTHVQLHGDEGPSLAARLSLPVIRAFRAVPDAREIADWQDSFALLADGAAPGAYGGTGRAADEALVDAVANHPRRILAGGLGPANVAARVQEVRPWGIDASSGLEDAPGVKSHEKIRAFIAAARGALAGD